MKIKKAFSLFFIAVSLSISAIVLILASAVLPCDGFHTVCTLGVVLTIIVLVLIFILISLAYFLKPITSLISSTKEISNGNFDFSLPIDRKDEIGELARNFFDMKEKVRNTQKELLKLNVDSVGEKVEYEVIHNSITDGIVVLDDKLRMRIMNSAAEKLLKISKKETLEKVFSDVVKTKDPETGKTIEKLINDFNDSGRDKFFPEDILKISSDSDLHEIKLNMSKIFVNDNFFGLGLVFHDMTKIRQMEKELVKRQKLESVSVLAGGVAHNFNNALMGILGNLQLAQKYAEKEGAEKQNHYLSKAIVATKGAGEITEQLLVFSRGGDPVKKTIRFGDMLRKTVRFTMTSSQTDAKMEISEVLHNVHADIGQMKQLISNVLINSIQAVSDLGKKAEIIVSAENIVLSPGEIEGCEGAFIKLSVRDNGPGIPENHLSKIFDPFFTTKEHGSGLGLSTSMSIAERHGGKMEIYTEEGEYTEVVIFLPAVIGEAVENRNKNSDKENMHKGYKVLVMDDEELIRDVLENILVRFGCDVDAVSNGDEAVELFRHSFEKGEEYDVLILDLTVKEGMGGVETLKNIKKICPNIKAIISSGYIEDGLVDKYKESGFSAVVKKPYSLEDLKEAFYDALNS